MLLSFNVYHPLYTDHVQDTGDQKKMKQVLHADFSLFTVWWETETSKAAIRMHYDKWEEKWKV